MEKMNLYEMKKKITEVVRVLANGDILTLNVGHVSVRVSETEMLIIGHMHKKRITFDEITEEDIILVDFSGNVIEGQHTPPGEMFMHSGIYKKRMDVQSVIHAHPWYSMAFGIAGKPIMPAYWRGTIFSPETPILNYVEQIDTDEKGSKVAEALGKSCAMLFRGHGVAVVGQNLEEACTTAFALEKNAEIQLYANILGGFDPIKPEELAGHKSSSAYSYYLKKYGGQDR